MNNLKNNVSDIVEILKKGGVAIFPTDTVYGIGALPIRNLSEGYIK